MNDVIIKDSLNVVNQVSIQSHANIQSLNWWMWIAIIEFGVILFFIFIKKVKNPENAKQAFKNDSLKHEIDFNNIINSSFNSISLYNELKVKCHPDRFPNDVEKNKIAGLIYQEISINKTNVKKLIELKEEAREKLQINF